jgi:hypothetical protein
METFKQIIDDFLVGTTGEKEFDAIIKLLLAHGCIRQVGNDWAWTHATDSVWVGSDGVNCQDLVYEICGGEFISSEEYDTLHKKSSGC